MGEQIRIWQVQKGDSLQELPHEELDLEARLENWLASDIRVLSPDLLVIGKQVQTASGGVIDLLCIDRNGDLVIVELKRSKTPRDITAQVLDYASWVSDLSSDQVLEIAAKYGFNDGSLEEAFNAHFGASLPEIVNEQQRMLIVGSRIDSQSERVIKYLSSKYGVQINAVTFQYFKQGPLELLGSAFLFEPEDQLPAPKGKRRVQKTVDQLLDEIQDDRYRQVVETLLREFEDNGFILKPGSSGLSIRREIPDRGTPVSVGWFFPPGVKGWQFLCNLVLGYEAAPSPPFTASVMQVLRAYQDRLEKIPGAERVKHTTMHAFHLEQETVAEQARLVKECIAWLGREFAALE
jgi:hypothetical protein